MRVLTVRPDATRTEGQGEAAAEVGGLVRFAIRLGVGLVVGAVVGPPLQQGLALASLRLIVTLALAATAAGLLTMAVIRTWREWR
jgi:hypothetical protein